MLNDHSDDNELMRAYRNGDDDKEKDAAELRRRDSNSPAPDEGAESKERRHILGSCVQSIRNQKIRVLLCLWLKQFKQREIADLTGLKTGTVGGLLDRGKNLLRECVRAKYAD